MKRKHLLTLTRVLIVVGSGWLLLFLWSRSQASTPDTAFNHLSPYQVGLLLLVAVLLLWIASLIILRLRASQIALRQSEAKFRNLFENSQVGIFRVRIEDGMILDANDRFLAMLNYTTADVIGHMRTTDFYRDPRDRSRALELLRTNGEIHNFETQFRRRDGSVFWGLFSARFNKEDGCLDGVMTDITERKRDEEKRRQVEAALQASEAELRGLFAAMTDVILIYNREGRCLKLVSTNPALLIKSSEEQVNHTVYESLPLEQAQFHHRHIQQALDTRRTLSVEYSLMIADRKAWFSASISPLSDDTVLWVARDITSLKQAEEALRQSEATNRALIGAIPDLLLRVRGDGTYLGVMTSGEFRLLNPDQLAPGTKVKDSLPRDRAQERMHHIHQALQTNKLQVYEQTLLISGELRDEEVRIIPIHADEGLIMVRDITERKKNEAALKQAVDAAEAANRAKSIFLANMSHELRTPLNIILGFTQLLMRNGNLNPQQQEHINTINRSGEHLLTLINDVLEMSKIEAGKITLNETDFDLHDLLDWLHQMFQFKAQSKGLKILIEKADDLPEYIRSDESKLRQVLVNLVGNAVKFTDRGTVVLRVSPSLPYSPPITPLPLHFAVIDTGPGIAPADLAKLFKPFVQTELGEKSHEGTGLGLAISQKFVQLMGGEITVSSVVHQGTVFQFTIPVQAVATGIQSSASSQSVTGLEPGQPTYRILVVEDKPENRQILNELLSPLGFAVREACHGEEAIALWEAWSPHLIWMDIRMPVMDGYEATRRIKAASLAQNRPSPVIIAVTGSVFEEDRKVALAMGCSDFVRKPFRAEEIFERMAEHLGIRYTYVAATPQQGSNERSPTSSSSEPGIEQLQQTLADMPADWVTQLRQAASRVNAKQVTQLIEQLPPTHTTLATSLTRLVEDFCFEEIVALIDSTP